MRSHEDSGRAGVPACSIPWDSQLPDGVWHEYQSVLQRWPGAAAHIDEEFREYLKLEVLNVVDGPGPHAESLAEQEEAEKL